MMIEFQKIDMAAATRLTKAGRLKEALAVLGGGVKGATLPEIPEPLKGFLGRLGGAKPAARPAARPVGGLFTTHQFNNAAGTRAYKLFVPTQYRGQKMPLIVMLHGCTQSPDDFAAGTGMNRLAETHGFLVAYPAQAKAANFQKCWNWFNPQDQTRGSGEASLIAGIAGQVVAEYAVDRRRIYAAGLSAGGAAAAICAVAYPDVFAAIGVHSGLACGAAQGMAGAFGAMQQGGGALARNAETVPTIVFHGDADRTVSKVNGAQVIEQAGGDLSRGMVMQGEAGGVRYTKTVIPQGEHWLLHGAGHAWSGGNPAGSFTDARGPDASAEMVRFFLAHPKG
jgi:poly(hydroxyalkanoate) depolymerase family esterase